MFLISKLVPALLFPLPLAIFAALLAAGWCWRRQARAPAVLVALVAFGLWISSAPIVASALARSLETEYPVIPPAQLPAADAIVVLAGCVHRVGPPLDAVEVADSFDRVLHAARIYRLGKAPLIVASGGAVPFVGHADDESLAMAELLVTLAVPKAAILPEGRSRNTRENAIESFALLAPRGAHRILLVTSALHMPRAMQEFEEVGFAVIAAPCDFRSSSSSAGIFGLTPQAVALGLTSDTVKEYLGAAVASWRR